MGYPRHYCTVRRILWNLWWNRSCSTFLINGFAGQFLWFKILPIPPQCWPWPCMLLLTCAYHHHLHLRQLKSFCHHGESTFRPRWTRDITQSASATCLWRYHFYQRLGLQRPPWVVTWGQKLEVGVCTAWAMEEREREKNEIKSVGKKRRIWSEFSN